MSPASGDAPPRVGGASLPALHAADASPPVVATALGVLSGAAKATGRKAPQAFRPAGSGSSAPVKRAAHEGPKLRELPPPAVAVATTLAPQEVRLSIGEWMAAAPRRPSAGAVHNMRLASALLQEEHSGGSYGSHYSDIDLAPLPLRQASSGAEDMDSPPLLRRERAQEPHASSTPLTRAASVQQPLASENSAASTDSTIAAAAKGLALLRLPSGMECDGGGDSGVCAESPPKHKRGEREAQQAGLPAAAAAAAATPPLVQAPQRACLKTMAHGVRSGAGQGEPAAGAVTPPPAALPAATSGDKRTPVPRLDLTPVLAAGEHAPAAPHLRRTSSGASGCEPCSLDATSAAHAGQQQTGGCLFAAHDHMDASAGAMVVHGSQGFGEQPAAQPMPHATATPATQGKGAGSAAAGGGGAASRRSAGSGAPASRQPGAAASDAPAEEAAETFYVYQRAVPAEEVRGYEEVRRTLEKAGRPRAVAHLDRIWGDVLEARANCEAMAFRGHRLLDQVTNEYQSFKREAEHLAVEAEEKVATAEATAAAWKQQADLALAVVPASGMELALKDQALQHQAQRIQQLEASLAIMQECMGADAGQLGGSGDVEPHAQARVIAESATASILLRKAIEQQQEIQVKGKMISDLKAALLLVCGVLKRTSYTAPDDPVRMSLPSDMVGIVDSMLTSTRVEEMLSEQQAASAAFLGAMPLPGSLEAGGCARRAAEQMLPSCVVEEAAGAGRGSQRWSDDGEGGPAGTDARGGQAPNPLAGLDLAGLCSGGAGGLDAFSLDRFMQPLEVGPLGSPAKVAPLRSGDVRVPKGDADFPKDQEVAVPLG